MNLFLEILKAISQLYLWMCFWNIVIFWKQQSQYDKIYKTLPYRIYFYDKEQEIVFSTPLFTDQMIIWMYKKNSFGLRNGIYLYNSWVHYLNSPYTIYWLWKYKKWFKTNLDLSVLEEKKIKL